MVEQAHPETYRQLLATAQADVTTAYAHLEQLARLPIPRRGRPAGDGPEET